MANRIQPLEKLTKNEILELMNACVNFDAGNILGPDYKSGEVVSYGIPEMNLYWKTKRDFEKDVKLITRTNSIVEANKALERRLPDAPTEASQTVPTKAERETQEAERVKREASEKEAKENAGKNFKSAEAEKEKLAKATLQKRQQEIQASLKDKKAVVIPTENLQKVTLTPKEKELIYNLAQAVKTDAGTAQKIIEQKIRESVDKSSPEIQENITEPIITRAAADLVEKVKPFAVYENPSKIPDNIPVRNPISLLIPITDLNNPKLKGLVPNNETREELSQSAQSLSVSIEAKNNINYSLTKPIFENSENIQEIFYSQRITPYKLAEDQEKEEEGDTEIDLTDVYHKGKDVWGLWQKLTAKTVTVDDVVNSTAMVTYTPSATITVASEASSLATTALPATIGAVLDFRTGVVLTNYFASYTTPLLTEGVAVFSQPLLAAPAPSFAFRMFVNGVEVPISVSNMTVLTGEEAVAEHATVLTENVTAKAGGVAAKQSLNVTIGNAVAKGAAWVATQLGATAAAETILATVGTGIIPVIGTIAGLILGAIFGKVIEKIATWAKKHQEDLKIVGGAMLVGGVVINSIPVIIVGGLVFVPTALSTGFSMARFATRALQFFGRIARSMVINIATPVIVVVCIIPILVVIVLFIINSGAYIVPPTSSLQGLQNPYINIEKDPNPEGPFNNSDIPSKTKIEYTVTVSAKKGPLTNITFKDECRVVKNGTPPSCPPPSQGTPTPPNSISPSSPFTFKYTVSFTSHDYDDSAIINTFTVTADTAEEKGVTSATSASIVIGKPPMECPNNAWPLANDEGIDNVTQGPMTPLGWTHHNTPNAIDIGVNGATVIATHAGTVTVGEAACGGRWIEISSSCGSIPFFSYYGHLGAATVTTGQKVTVGQTIGISDNTGSCSSGPHLHFQFFPTTNTIPATQKPYLKRDVPIGCPAPPVGTCNP